MKLLVTENLVSDINKLNSFNITLEKMSIKDGAATITEFTALVLSKYLIIPPPINSKFYIR